MSEVAPAKVRVEIHRQHAFFDDHFCAGWVKNSVATSAFTKDGDVGVLDHGDQTFCEVEHALANVNSTTYHHIAVRVTRTTGLWSLKVRNISDYNFSIFTDEDTTGLFEATLPGSQTLEAVILYAYGETDFDYISITKETVLAPDLGDLVEQMTVTRPRLNEGITGALFSIPNFAGAYNGLITKHDIVLIWLARADVDLGVPHHKVFGGKVMAVVNRADGYGHFYIDIDAHGHAYELESPPDLLNVFYSAVNGRTIIEEALALCTYLVKHPVATSWFDNTGSAGSTDDTINSTHDFDVTEESLASVIKDVLESAKNPSAVQGFDAFEDPSGTIIGHLRNSLDFVSAIASVTPRSYENSSDAHPVKNVITVYGKFGGQIPSDTNFSDSIDSWSATLGTLSYVATSYVYCDKTGGNIIEFGRTFAPFERLSGLSKTTPLSATHVSFGIFTDKTPVALNVFLLAPDDSNYFYQALTVTAGVESTKTLELGPDGGWSSNGSPEWKNLKAIRWTEQVASNPFYCFIHNLKFIGARFRGEASDGTSQGLYGVQIRDPEIDEMLNSSAECVAKAQTVLVLLKDPTIALSDVTTDGELFLPTYRQRIVVANDALDAYYPIVKVKHVVKGSSWDSVLTLSSDKQIIDFVFKYLNNALTLLGRKA